MTGEVSHFKGDHHGLGFIGVHIGAGQHAEARTPKYLSICAEACAKGIEILRKGGNALDAATEATMVLENAGETNAGYGSNLTESGSVEMDAGIMDGSSLLFGAVGAMPAIKNPIQVAKLLLQEQNKGLLPLGRVPPIFMVGDGAKEWANRHGINSVPPESLVSDKAKRLFKHYTTKLDSYRNSNNSSHHKSKKRDSSVISGSTSKRLNCDLDDNVNDTVGVVVMDKMGNVASTVSSGGIALKQPGRVGQASCFGCGCWAQNETQPNGISVGISTTGCGEHLVRTSFAKECAVMLAKSEVPMVALKDMMTDNFVSSEYLASVSEKLGGAICLHFDRKNQIGEFLWTHTTASMGLAYQTTNCVQATAKMSRLPAEVLANNKKTAKPNNNTTILVESVNISNPLMRHRRVDSKDSEEIVMVYDQEVQNIPPVEIAKA